MAELTDQVRRDLPPGQSRALMLGHPLTVLGALALTLASTLLWLFVAGYGLSFSALRPMLEQRLEGPARVESSQSVALFTGEPAHRTTALFSYEGAVHRAVGYGEPLLELRPGETVTVVMPANSPGQAWVRGLQRFPVRLSMLPWVAGTALLPGLLLTLWGLLNGHRQRLLVRDGRIVTASRTHHWSLPRPLSEQFLDRFVFTDPAGRQRSLWSIGANSAEQTSVLTGPHRRAGAAVLERILPGRGPALAIPNGRRYGAIVVALLWLTQLFILGLYALT